MSWLIRDKNIACRVCDKQRLCDSMVLELYLFHVGFFMDHIIWAVLCIPNHREVYAYRLAEKKKESLDIQGKGS